METKEIKNILLGFGIGASIITLAFLVGFGVTVYKNVLEIENLKLQNIQLKKENKI